jgi:hypothetical protein
MKIGHDDHGLLKKSAEQECVVNWHNNKMIGKAVFSSHGRIA